MLTFLNCNHTPKGTIQLIEEDLIAGYFLDLVSKNVD